ncbi:Metallo-beta-lactamase [Gracilaria domingensis]|nr:Metallo-beta-lactamase [Gracilaria domingensis]
MKFSAIFFLAAACFAWRASASGYTCPRNPSILTFSLASLNCTLVSDGPIEFPSLTDVFTVPEAAVARSYRRNFRSSTPLIFSQNVLVVELPTGRALFDTGSFRLTERLPQFPLYENAGQLMSNLEAAGIPPTTIQYVFLTHGHVDHVSGLVDSDGRRAFPHADVFVGLKEHLFWSNSTPSAPESPSDDATFAEFARIYQGSVGPYDRVGRLHLVDTENEEEASPMEGITYMSAFGHSPGHSAIEIKQDDESMVLVGDAWLLADLTNLIYHDCIVIPSLWLSPE